MHDQSDSELLLQLKNDDSAAFTELYKRYWRSLYRIAFGILRQQQPAEDLLQDVFMSVWRRRKELDIVNLEPYLARAVKLRVLMAIRDSKAEYLFEEILPQLSVNIMADAPLLFKELQHLFVRLTGQLPADCQEIFRLSRDEKLTYREIAARLNISVKTVEKKMSRSLHHFRTGMSKAILLLLH